LEQVIGLAPDHKRMGVAALSTSTYALTGRETDVNEKQLFVYRETARSIERAFPRSDLAREFGIELNGKMSIYDALVKASIAKDFHDAVKVVAARFPPSRAGFTSSWSELSLWLWDYDHA